MVMMIRADSTKTLPLKDCSVDAIITDPPYGLEFMNKDWDKLDSVIKPQSQWWEGEFKGTGFKRLPQPTGSKNFKCRKCGHYKYSGTPCKCESPNWEYSTIKKQHEMQLWHTQWLTEAYRVLKPGGSMLVMGGTRTFHRLMCAIEDAGFIIKDTLMWIYGSGFPKAQEASVLVDAKILGISTKEVNEKRKVVGVKPGHEEFAGRKTSGHITALKNTGGGGFARPWMDDPIKREAYHQSTAPLTPEGEHWDGFKIGGIKPAYEPIVWAVKPPEGSYVDNVLKWNIGAVNVEETRINGQPHHNEAGRPSGEKSFTGKGGSTHTPASGRFPANIILGHHPECVQVGMKRIKSKDPNRFAKTDGGWAVQKFHNPPKVKIANSDGYETVESWRCHPDCPVKVLDEQSGNLQSGKDNVRRKEGFFVEHGGLGKAGDVQVSYGDSGGASRFFKQCNYGQEEWLCHEGCALRQVDEQSGVSKSSCRPPTGKPKYTGSHKDSAAMRGSSTLDTTIRGHADSGGASRFFYCAKASRSERNAGLEGMEENKERLFKDRKLIVCNICGCKAMKEAPGKQLRCGHNDYKYESVKHEANYKNNHPTVKPIRLFEWLIKLVTREGQTVLDPFIGSGTTAIATYNTGRKCIGIEKEQEYLEIAKRRTAYWNSQPKQMEMRIDT